MRGKSKNVLLSAAAVLLGATMAVTAPTQALAQQQCASDSGPSKTLDTRTAQALGVVFEQMTAEQYQAALAGLNQLIASRGDNMKPFDKATTYELRGSVKANLEDYPGAIRDFQTALDTGALPAARNNQLRYFVAQLNVQIEQYQVAISGLNDWIRYAQQCDIPVDSNAYYLLAAAYTQITPPNWRAAQRPAEQAIQASAEPRKGYYDLLNLVYSELGDNAKRGPLLEQMIGYWPGNKAYWTQLSGAYSQAGQDRDAFAVLEVAYRAGLLTTESEMLTLVQYYSFFENPYRGAKMMEREMAAGNIKRNQKNLVLLSQLWSQSREHKKSIPVLQSAAGQAPNGELYYRLGQVLLADEQYRAAENALTSALNRGGMKAKDTGDAWLLLGTARFSQAGPEDVAIWARAREAFVNAQRYEGARTRARDWIAYIDAVASTYRAGIELERQQNLERCQDDLERSTRNLRIMELENRQPSAEESAEREQLLAQCGPDAAPAEAPAEEAAPADADTPELNPAADTLNTPDGEEDTAEEGEDSGAEN